MNRKDKRLTEAQRTGKSGKQRALRRPPEGQPFVWLTREMLESAAYRALSGNSLKVLARLCIEDQNHAGTENGNLICTHQNLIEYGVRRNSIAPAIRELEYFGWIRTVKGAAYKGNRTPSIYRLTWLPNCDGEAPSNEWKAIADCHVEAFMKNRSTTNAMKIKRKQAQSVEGSKRVIPLRVVGDNS